MTPKHIKISEAPGYAITETVALITTAMSFSHSSFSINPSCGENDKMGFAICLWSLEYF